jgi:hypothetical protein
MAIVDSIAFLFSAYFRAAAEPQLGTYVHAPNLIETLFKEHHMSIKIPFTASVFDVACVDAVLYLLMNEERQVVDERQHEEM